MLIVADIIWPALLLEGRIFTWWAILIGLVVEFFVVLRVTRLPPGQALLADVSMNAASTILGILMIPLAGIAWELFPGSVVYSLFNMGTFNPLTWIATVLMAVAINAFVEKFVLNRFFGQAIGKRGFWLLFIGNTASVGLAVASLIFKPPRL